MSRIAGVLMPTRREANESGAVVLVAATISPRRLTPREVQILDAYERCGLLTQVAYDLGISYQTVKNHAAHIQRKLGSVSIGQAAVRFERQTRGVERRKGRDRRRG